MSIGKQPEKQGENRVSKFRFSELGENDQMDMKIKKPAVKSLPAF